MWGQEPYDQPLPNSDISQYLTAIAYAHPRPNREFHYIVSTTQERFDLPGLQTEVEGTQEALLQMLSLAQQLVKRHELSAYSLLVNIRLDASEPRFAFHLVSGAGK